MKKIVCSFLGLIVLCTLTFNVKGENEVVTTGKKVKINYTLTIDGKTIDSSKDKDPLEYTHGNNMIIPGLEKELEGLKVGDSKVVIVSADDGYGPIDPNAIIELPKSKLGSDIIPEVGIVLSSIAPNGQKINGFIQEVKETTIVINYNHPLAGKELTFDVTIVGIE